MNTDEISAEQIDRLYAELLNHLSAVEECLDTEDAEAWAEAKRRLAVFQARCEAELRRIDDANEGAP